MTSERSSRPVRPRGIVCAAAAFLVTCGACGEEPRPRRQDPNTPNPPSVGFIDVPRTDEEVRPLTWASGWAVDESGIQRVRVYVDDQLVASVPLSGARPDVEKVLPQFAKPGARHGWSAEVDFGAKLGYSVIRVEALDGRGALTRFAHVRVRVVP